jgi:hypothetical protein
MLAEMSICVRTDGERLLECSEHLAGDENGIHRLIDLRQQDDELVATEARNGIRSRGTQAFRRSATSLSNRSPMSCPSVSLTGLN